MHGIGHFMRTSTHIVLNMARSRVIKLINTHTDILSGKPPQHAPLAVQSCGNKQLILTDAEASTPSSLMYRTWGCFLTGSIDSPVRWS